VIVGALSAIRMVTTKNVVHGALYLVITLGMVGATYLILAAEFVAWVQIVIYVGAIACAALALADMDAEAREVLRELAIAATARRL